MTETELAFASIEQVAPLIRKKKISPVELAELMLRRIERLNPKLNAYISVTADLAMQQARKAEARFARREAAPVIAARSMEFPSRPRTNSNLQEFAPLPGRRFSPTSFPKKTPASPFDCARPAPFCSARRICTSLLTA